MYQSINLPIYEEMRKEYGGWDNLRADCAALGINGVEGIWAGEEITDFPKDLVVGYHLTFFPDWLDFYRENKEALIHKYGTLEKAYAFYGGSNGPETIMKMYREDLARARGLGAKYVVFHVSDVSNEEGFTYRWLHSNREVLDASLEIINQLVKDLPEGMEFLVENQWWAGFTFTDPQETAYLLDGIHCANKGILIDTGHMMNGNTSLTSEKNGVEYIQNMVDRHGELSKHIRALHLHQSLSGVYVRRNTGFLPEDFPIGDANAQFTYCYQHILQIDRHQPWTDPSVARLVERIGPEYLTHELSGFGRAARMRAASTQIETLKKGGLLP